MKAQTLRPVCRTRFLDRFVDTVVNRLGIVVRVSPNAPATNFRDDAEDPTSVRSAMLP
jgi:hypothetical protein